MSGLAYLDASAIVKLVVEEAESAPLRRLLSQRPQRVSSALALVEVHQAAARRVPAPTRARVDTILAGVTLVPVDLAVLELAAALGRPALRALDAVHLATAQSLGDDLAVLIAYDKRLLAAAEAAGLPLARTVDGD